MFKPMLVGRKLELPEFSRISKGKAVASGAALAARRVMRDRPSMINDKKGEGRGAGDGEQTET